jgi:hypothetical protein
MMIDALLLGHVLLTTAGYVGLIASNVYVLFLSRSRDPHAIRVGLTAWRHSSQVFGPFLLVGVFFGFGLASAMHVSLGSLWLVSTYILIVAAIAVQASVMIPWQLRSNPMLEAGIVPRMTPVVLVLIALCVSYTSILWLMLARPG